MTKSVDMEPTESIYEEIITREFGARSDRKRLDRSLSCPSSRKTSREMGRHCSASNICCEENDESLYAVVQGEELEFKKLKDLLEEEERKETRGSLKRVDGATSIAQILETGEDKDLGETDSGCDCSASGREVVSAGIIPRPSSLDLKMNDTVYSEILHLSPASQIDLLPGRFTRESDNPILRQEVIPSNSASPTTSMPPSRNGSMRSSKNNGGSTRSGSGDSGIQEDLPVQMVYENCARREKGLRRSLSSPQFYANTASLKSQEISVYANMDECENVASEKADSVYANMDDEPARPRASSRPIAIQSNQRKNTAPTELIYSDLDFDEEQIPEYLSNSLGDASSTSSGFSSFTSHVTNTFTPPPLPNRPASVCARRRQTSFSSVSMSSYAGASSLKANFIGTHTVHKASKESVDQAVKEVVNKTNILDIKSACVEISSNFVKFGNLTSPYHSVVQFRVDEVHVMEQYSKDKRFMGFIVSQPGKEAVCHVFQSDQTAEIIEVVKDTFIENPWKQRLSSPDRPKSISVPTGSYGQTSFRGIVKIGSVKVKKSYLVINECIRMLLDKINPKEYKSVNIEIKESFISVIGSDLSCEEHSIPWILSLGLYNEDGRYFGYIVSRTKNGKTRMFCHVYKCTKVMTSASILEGIRNACQSALVHNQVPRYSSSMPKDAFRNRLKTSPDAVSRCSVSSDDTTRDSSSPRMVRKTSVGSRSTTSTPKMSRVLPNFQDDAVQQLQQFEEETKVVMTEESMQQTTNEFTENDSDIAKEELTLSESKLSEKEDEKQRHEMDSKAHYKEKRSPFLKGKGKMFRNTLIRRKRDSKLSASMQSFDFSPKEEEELAIPFEREEHKFAISYLCSAVVKPPLKSKHIEKCLKQYQKEVGKKQKVGEPCCLGNILLLEIVTDEGITMADIRNPNAFRRHFPISTIDSFIVHQENPDCFAFSTTVPGDEQHKYHVFYKAKESVSTIKEVFERLKVMQRIV